MKNMKKIITILCFCLGMFTTTSCLKSNLDELPTYEECDILNFNFEYRWFSDTLNHLVVTTLDTKTVIDNSTLTITCDITVPSNKSTLPDSVRTNVSLKNIVGYCDVSPAAIISPMDDAPMLGDIQDFSGDNIQYYVQAADGSSKIWTLKINSFNNN